VFPAFKQYREKFFLFFLIIAVGDPIGLTIIYILKNNIGPIQPLIVSFLLVISVINTEKLKNNWFVIIIVLSTIFMIPIIYGHSNAYYIVIILFHLMIFYKILILFIKKYLETRNIDLFYVLIMLYILLNIFKVNGLVFQFENAKLYHFVTTVFQTAIGIYFSLIKESSPKNLIRINTL